MKPKTKSEKIASVIIKLVRWVLTRQILKKNN